VPRGGRKEESRKKGNGWLEGLMTRKQKAP
jgi:hypothetical protein